MTNSARNRANNNARKLAVLADPYDVPCHFLDDGMPAGIRANDAQSALSRKFPDLTEANWPLVAELLNRRLWREVTF